jgi:hypothetical protein
MSTVVIKPPGQAVPQVDKRALESIVYTLDLNQLLEPKEQVVEIAQVLSADLIIADEKIKLAKNIELRIMPSGLNSALDNTVTVLFNTNLGNMRAAVFQVSVHR